MVETSFIFLIGCALVMLCVAVLASPSQQRRTMRPLRD